MVCPDPNPSRPMVCPDPDPSEHMVCPDPDQIYILVGSAYRSSGQADGGYLGQLAIVNRHFHPRQKKRELGY